MNDRLPEMIWAALLIAGLGRDAALAELRGFLRFVFQHPDKEGLYDATLTGFAQLPEKLRNEVIAFLCRSERNRGVLALLLLFDALPARATWAEQLQDQPPFPEVLMEAVRLTLFHQSQEATDCRWVRLMSAVFVRRMIIPQEELLLLNAYPVKGDQTIVRPSIRAAEGAMDAGESRDRSWPRAFWNECWEKTPCMAPASSIKTTQPKSPSDNIEITSLALLRQHLTAHWENTHSTTAIDARHDATFGIALYAIRLVQEVLSLNHGQTILGRLALRTLLEMRITLAYLLKEESDDLWRTWRAYGAGQAKLASLKLDQVSDIAPHHLSTNVLRDIANEDFWEEVVSVDLGHWAGADLRKLSEQVNLKSDYNRYHGWTSGFAHGQWGPIREFVFRTCLNPLHRGHRCPYTDEPRRLTSVRVDVGALLNGILSEVDRAYPSFPDRLALNQREHGNSGQSVEL
ncbi:MAG: DUF5677 domain-containing protein [Acidobacteriota bacterium]